MNLPCIASHARGTGGGDADDDRPTKEESGARGEKEDKVTMTTCGHMHRITTTTAGPSRHPNTCVPLRPPAA